MQRSLNNKIQFVLYSWKSKTEEEEKLFHCLVLRNIGPWGTLGYIDRVSRMVLQIPIPPNPKINSNRLLMFRGTLHNSSSYPATWSIPWKPSFWRVRGIGRLSDIFKCLILFRYFTPTHMRKPFTNVKLGGSTCAWIKTRETTGPRSLVLNVLTEVFLHGRNLIGQHVHQVSFGCRCKFVPFSQLSL